MKPLHTLSPHSRVSRAHELSSSSSHAPPPTQSLSSRWPFLLLLRSPNRRSFKSQQHIEDVLKIQQEREKELFKIHQEREGLIQNPATHRGLIQNPARERRTSSKSSKREKDLLKIQQHIEDLLKIQQEDLLSVIRVRIRKWGGGCCGVAHRNTSLRVILSIRVCSRVVRTL